MNRKVQTCKFCSRNRSQKIAQKKKRKTLGKTKTLQTVALRVAILSDFSARRLSQNFGTKLKQKSAQVRAVSLGNLLAQNSHLQCYRLRCFSCAQKQNKTFLGGAESTSPRFCVKKIRWWRTTPNLKARKAVSVFLATFSPVRQGLFPCSTALFLKNSHRAGPVLQEFGFVLQAGVWHSTSVVQALPWG